MRFLFTRFRVFLIRSRVTRGFELRLDEAMGRAEVIRWTALASDNVVMHHDFKQPITEEQLESAYMNDEVARALVRRANLVDLEKIAEGVRHVPVSSLR